MIRACDECGKEFTSACKTNRFCSRLCYAKYRSRVFVGGKNPAWSGGGILKTCKICGKTFTLKKSENARENRDCCSKPCANKAQTKQVTLSCVICKNEFSIPLSQFKRGNANCCSLACRAEWKKKTINKNCLICGKEFETKPSLIKRGGGKYCSEYCAGLSKLNAGNPNWRDGASFDKYCEKFNANFKKRVRAFFDCKCVECGSPENGKRHAVHHVNFRKDSCCDQEAPRLFVALCASCHSKTSYNRQYWERHFTDLINQYYGGKCYFTKEEMKQLTETN